MKPIAIHIADHQTTLPVSPVLIRRVVRFVLRQFPRKNAAVSVALVDSSRIRKLKKQFFHRARTTDVLSFNLNGDASSPDSLDCEIVINAQRAAQWARQHDSDPLAEFSLYLVHGLLHQLGFDDRSETLAKTMHNKEDKILKQLGFGAVYYRKG